MQVTTQVREAGRNVNTNLKRVEATRKARELAERRLEAEEKRFTVGLSTTFELRPGPARPRPRAPERAERDDRLQPVAGRLRSRPDRPLAASVAATAESVPRATAVRGARSARLLALRDLARRLGLGTLVRRYCVDSLRAEADRHGHHAERSGEHRGGARVGRLGRRDRRRRRRQHRRHGGDRATAWGARGTRAWPGYSAQKNYAASIASHDWILSLDADERVTPALAAEISATPRHRAREPRLPHAARHLVSRPLDPHDRLVSRLPAAPLRSAQRRVERAPRARVGSLEGRRAGPARERAAALRLPRHLRPPRHHRRYTTLAAEQWSAEGRRASVAGRRRPPALRVPSQLRPAGRIPRRRGRADRVGR